ncbi:hypothetical protein A0H81_06893 [Grifola frondosa]|uniref:C2H2-type domain-containing protein n=1 Tax=Grifola frondosa TaxID=5627 RepID=A0A1C7M8E5_GRIFR|nr:hypothetical protein A0H81_06893 [Grifola frondosa]
MSGSHFLYTHEIVGPNPYEEARVMQYTIALAAEYAETLANVAQEALDQVSKKASQASQDEFSTRAAAPSEVILPPASKRRKTMASVSKTKKKNAGASKSAPKKPGRSAKGEENCRRTACLYPGCSYSYTRPHDRDRHMQSHFEPQYHCEVPGCRRGAKGFFRHDALRRHMNSEHPGLEYVSKQLPFPWHSNTELIWKLKMPPADDFDPESCFLRRERQKMALHT